MTTANVWVDWLKALYESDYRSKMSLTAFSKIAGVSRPTLFNWFEDGVRPKRSQVVTVAEALGQDTEEALRMAGYRREAGADRSPRRPSDESPAILLYGGGKNLTQRQKDELARRVAETVEQYWTEIERTETE